MGTMVKRVGGVAALVVTTLLLLVPAAAAAAPDLAIAVSSSASGALEIGDAFSYTITATNHGSATVHDIVINDTFPVGVRPTLPLPTLNGGSCTFASSQQTGAPPRSSARCTLPALPAGGSVTVTIGVEVTDDVTCGTITNSSSVEAASEPRGATADNAASVDDTVTCPPSIAVRIDAPSFAHVGESVTFEMRVTNDGAADVNHVRIATPACSSAISLVDDGDGDLTLAPDEGWRYSCILHVSHATGGRLSGVAVGTGRAGDTRVSATDRVTVRVLRPRLTLQVTPGPVSGSPGDTITYRFVVRNTGDATLTDISVDDDRLGHVGDVARLVPGHSATFSVERILRATHPWVTDEAAATGEDPSGRRIRASDLSVVTIVAPNDAGSAEAPNGGTAFTGSDATVPSTIAVTLALIGGAALVAARRSRN